METLSVIIVDDERPARQRIADLLEVEDDVDVVGSYGDGRDAADAILDDEPDLVFLDVQMPGMDGLGVVRRVGPSRMPPVVFVTAFDRYAVQAFEAQALDYLLKPFEDHRFRLALSRAREHIRLRRVDGLRDRLLGLLQHTGAGENTDVRATSPPHGRIERLPVRERDRTIFLSVDRIDYIESDGPYARLHVGAKTHLIRERMHVLEDQLDPNRFARIHRSTIVNLDRIQAIESSAYGDYLVKLNDGTELRISRSRRDPLQERLGVRRL